MKTYAKNAGADDVDSYKEQVGEDNLKTMQADKRCIHITRYIFNRYIIYR